MKSPLHSRSRSNLFDSGPEVMNYLDESSVANAELPKMKSSSSVFPWLQIYAFMAWAIICLKVAKDSVLRMEDPNLRSKFFYEAFLYYNPLFMVAMKVWLWGVNLLAFQHFRVNYAKIFELDQHHLTHKQIWKIASWMTILVLTSMTAYLYLYSHGEVNLAASQPVYTPHFSSRFVCLFVCLLFFFFVANSFAVLLLCVCVHAEILRPRGFSLLVSLSNLDDFLQVLLYCALPLILALPADALYASSRFFFLRTLFRLSLPLQPITFADFFIADVLTSMSKVLSDIERSVCRMYNRQVATIAWFEADDVCGSHSVWIPCILALPYLFRFAQCIRQYSDTKERSCLFNALKYSTAFPVVFLSALKYHVAMEAWEGIYRPLWLFSSVVNSFFSFYWDISRDWDFSLFSGNLKTKNMGLRPNLMYSPRWVYHWAIWSNLLLRCAWTYKLSAHLRHNYLTVFTFSGLEMLRRFQWIFFRVENEHNKILLRSSASSQAADAESEMGLLVSTGDHIV